MAAQLLGTHYSGDSAQGIDVVSDAGPLYEGRRARHCPLGPQNKLGWAG